MTLKFAPAIEDAPTINVALIGPPKTGKTTGAASAPGPVLYVNTDLPTATRFARRKYGDRVREVVFVGMQTLVDVTHAAYDTTEYPTVVIDSVGDLYRRMLEDASNRAVRPSLPTYGDVSVYLERFLRSLCEAPVNAVFVCHDLPLDGEDGEDRVVLPFMGSTGKGGIKLGRQLLGMVDVIGFTGVARGEDGAAEYVAQLASAKGRGAGDRFNTLAGATGMRRLDLSEWIDAIRAAEKQDSGEETAAPANDKTNAKEKT